MDIVVTGINSYGKSDNHISNLTDLYNKIKNKFSCDVLVMSKQILYTQVSIIKLEFSLKEYYNKRLESYITVWSELPRILHFFLKLYFAFFSAPSSFWILGRAYSYRENYALSRSKKN